jgi:putative transposase
MKKSKVKGKQIAFALRQAEVGTPVAEVCRKMGVSELRKMRQFEDENQKLKRLVADLPLDKAMLQEVLSKKV